MTTGLQRTEDESLEDALEPLTVRQAAFVREYLVDLNGMNAAIRAGYIPDNAVVRASQLLTVPKIKHAVEIAKAQRAARTDVKADHVLNEMALLANARIDDYYVDDEGQVKVVPGGPDGAMAAIQSITRRTTMKFNATTNEVTKTYDVTIKLWDKPGALKLMGRHIGLFPDRVEYTGKDGGPIEVARIVREIVDPAVPAESVTPVSITRVVADE